MYKMADSFIPTGYATMTITTYTDVNEALLKVNVDKPLPECLKNIS